MKKIFFFILLICSTVNSQSTISYNVSSSNFGAPNLTIESLYWKFIPNGGYLISAITQDKYAAYKNTNQIMQQNFNIEKQENQNSFIHINEDFHRFIYTTDDSLYVFYTDDTLSLLSSIKTNFENIEKITPIGNNSYALLQRNNSQLDIVFLDVTLNQVNIVDNSELTTTDIEHLYLKELDGNNVLIFGEIAENSTYKSSIYSNEGDELFSVNIEADNVHRMSSKLYDDNTMLFTGIFSGNLSYNGNNIASTVLPTDNRAFIFAIDLEGNIVSEVQTALFTSSIPQKMVPTGLNSAVTINTISQTEKRLTKIDIAPLEILWQFNISGDNFSVSQIDATSDSTTYFSGNLSGTVQYGNTQLTSQGNTDAFYIKVTDRRNTTSISQKTESEILAPFIDKISPNPTNPTSTISFYIPSEENISVEVFDINGRVVKILEKGFKEKGFHTSNFDGSNLSSGLYFIRLSHSKGIKTQKITLIK